MNKIANFFDRYRLLDGYISILGMTFWYKIMAGYHTELYIWDFTLKWIFSTHCIYHSFRGYYPAFTFSFKLFGHGFDTGKQSAQKTHDEVTGWMQERKEKEAVEKAKIEEMKKRLAELEARK